MDQASSAPIAGGRGTFQYLSTFLPTMTTAMNLAGRLGSGSPVRCATDGISGDDAAPPKVPLNGHPNSWVSSADISAVSRRFGSCRPSNHFQRCCIGKAESWPSTCEAKRMRHVLSDETVGELEKLVSELRAIRHWDTEYRRSRFPECYETLAFAARQERRSEIILQLLRLSSYMESPTG